MPQYEEDNWGTIVFYCKDCNRIVGAERAGRKYVYRCMDCKTKNVAFGTEKSIRSFFHVRDEEPMEEGGESGTNAHHETDQAKMAGAAPLSNAEKIEKAVAEEQKA